jgi:hypothetical protein
MAAGVSPHVAAAFRRLSDTPLFPKPVRVDRLDAALREMAAGRV